MVQSKRFEAARSGAERRFFAENLFSMQKNGDTPQRTSGLQTKKMGCKFSFQLLVLTRESSNLFYANKINCKTSSSRPSCSKYV